MEDLTRLSLIRAALEMDGGHIKQVHRFYFGLVLEEREGKIEPIRKKAPARGEGRHGKRAVFK